MEDHVRWQEIAMHHMMIGHFVHGKNEPPPPGCHILKKRFETPISISSFGPSMIQKKYGVTTFLFHNLLVRTQHLQKGAPFPPQLNPFPPCYHASSIPG